LKHAAHAELIAKSTELTGRGYNRHFAQICSKCLFLGFNLLKLFKNLSF